MALKAGRFFTLQALLAGLEARFRIGRTPLFLANGGDLRFFLAEVLHQRNIARADPGAGSAFDAVRQIVGGGLVVLLPLAEPVKLLGQQIGRAGVRTGAAADAALLLLLFAHLADRRGQQAVCYFNHRNVEPGQGKAHQRAAHDNHLLRAGAKSGVLQQVANRGAKPRPDVARLRYGLAG